ncbi:MAG: type I restriction endonuclease subunit S [Nioella sp.]|nr:type I restriction endonuclease subunit S [Nioella sp.]
MIVEKISIGQALDLFNGKKPVLSEAGTISVFGSNGKIGTSEVSNHDSSIVLGRVGAYCGAVKFSPDPFWASDNTIVARPKEGHDLKYWYYKLYGTPLRSYAGGAAQPLITHSIVKPIEVPYHSDIGEQQKIASILTAYDDLIENNRRRIALLEEAARLLYREWFVHFRFPGHEHVKIVDGVPEGWTDGTVFDFIDVLSGGTPKTTEPSFWDGEIPFFTPKDATDSVYAFETEKSITEEGLAKCNSRLYPKDTLFITARGTVGKLNLAQVPMAMNQSCYALASKCELPQVFLYFGLHERIAHLKGRAAGAVFDAIIVDTFKKIPFLKPPENLVLDFMDIAGPSISQIDVLQTQTRALVAARDLLLPRLMDGRIEV